MPPEEHLLNAGIPMCRGINSATDPDVMSMAGFVSTSASRKFRKAAGKGSPKLVMEGFLTKVFRGSEGLSVKLAYSKGAVSKLGKQDGSC